MIQFSSHHPWVADVRASASHCMIPVRSAKSNGCLIRGALYEKLWLSSNASTQRWSVLSVVQNLDSGPPGCTGLPHAAEIDRRGHDDIVRVLGARESDARETPLRIVEIAGPSTRRGGSGKDRRRLRDPTCTTYRPDHRWARRPCPSASLRRPLLPRPSAERCHRLRWWSSSSAIPRSRAIRLRWLSG